MVIGIAGRYCSGKDTVAEHLKSKGFVIIDVDRTGHQVLSELKNAIEAAFGKRAIADDGSVDRKALGRIVFSDSRQRLRLESIIHPAMVKRVEILIDNGTENMVINAAILFRMGLQRLCDAVVFVRAPFLQRLRRALRRDGLSLQETLQRLFGQGRILIKEDTEDVDIYHIRNAGSLPLLKRRIDAFLMARDT